MYLKVANPLQKCQLKFSSDKRGVFEGYASVFNSTDMVNDTIIPGAFKKTLSEVVPKMFVNHDHTAIPIGDWKDMREDDFGLYAVGEIDLNHKDGPTAYSALRRGALDGMSIGFRMNPGDYEMKADGGRNIKNVDLFEVSLVNFPCEGQARISEVKQSDIQILSNMKEVEMFLRDVGLSNTMAKTLLSQIKQILIRDGSGEFKQISEYEQRIRELEAKLKTQNTNRLIDLIGELK